MKQLSRSPWWLLPITLLALILRLYHVSELSLRGDEAATVFTVRVPWGDLWAWLVAPNPQQPLYYVLQHLTIRAIGDGELAVRAISIVSGVLLVPLVYLWTRRFFTDEGERVALWAAGLAAINPLFIWDAQDNRMYALLGLLNVAVCYFSVASLRKGTERRAWAGYVLSATLALYTHYLAVFVLLAANLVWAVIALPTPTWRQHLRRWVVAQAVTLGLFAPWLVHSLFVASSFSTDFLTLPSWAEMARRTLISFSLGRSVGYTEGPILSMGFLVIALGGLAPLTQGMRPGPTEGEEEHRTTAGLSSASSTLAMLIYLLVPLACIIAFSRWRFSIFDENYIAISIPPFVVLLARGLAHVSRRGVQRWLAILGLLWIVLATSRSLYNYYYVSRYLKGGVNWRAYVARLLECAQPGDFFVQNYPDPGMTYHLHDRMPRVLLPSSFPVDVAATEAELQRLSAEHARLWVQPEQFPGWDAEGMVETWLNRHAYKVGEERFDKVRLALYLPYPGNSTLVTPLSATLGSQVRLLGYTLERTPADPGRALCAPLVAATNATFRPADRLSVTLYWQALEPLTEDYSVFVHIYGTAMEMRAQHDGMPVGATYATSRWQRGEVVVDRHDLTLAPDTPPGECRLAVGMYLLQTGVRLRAQQTGVPEAKDTIWVQTLQISD